MKEIIEKSKLETGKFAKKLFVVCKNISEFSEVLEGFKEAGHRQPIKDTHTYELGKTGMIIFLAPTLMQWGEVKIIKNTLTNRNKLRQKGYQEIL